MCASTRSPMKSLPAAALLVTVCAIGAVGSAQPPALTIVVTGQSMLRSDLRATKPAALLPIRELLKGDVLFTNLESVVAAPGESVREGRGFLTPPAALDALTA